MFCAFRHTLSGSPALLALAITIGCQTIASGQYLLPSSEPGGSLYLDGVDDYVDIGPSLNYLNFPATVALWIKPMVIPTGFPAILQSSQISSAYSGLTVNLTPSGVSAGIGDGVTSTSASRYTLTVNKALNPGEWFHLAVVFHNANQFEIYINGLLQNGTYSGQATQMNATPSGTAVIGRKLVNDDAYLHAEIDHLSVWEDALTEGEIRSIMCTRQIPQALGTPAILFDVNDTTSPLINGTGSGVNGTLMNGATKFISGAPIGSSSFFAYAPGMGAFNWTVNGHSNVLNNITGGPQGVQMYTEDLEPDEIPDSCTHYERVGVFIADDNFANSFSYDISASMTPFRWKRQQAGRSFQVAGDLTQETNRGEYLREIPLTYYLDDTALCGLTSLTYIIPAGINVIWDNGSTSGTRTINTYGTYWADLTVGACTYRDSLVISSTASIQSISIDTTLCDEDSLFIDLSNYPSVIWDDNFTGSVRWLHSGNTYSGTITDAQGCDFRIEAVIHSGTLLTYYLPESVEICSGESYELTVPSYLPNVQWSTGETGTSIFVDSEGTYWFESGQSCGTFSDTVEISQGICIAEPIWIPGSFTPNGDGLNDVFRVFNLGELSINMSIRDRWGNIVFQTYEPDYFWDGTFEGRPCQAGVYQLLLQVQRTNGEFETYVRTIVLTR